MPIDKPALAKELDRIRRERNISVRELSDLSQINYTYVSKILAGRHIPSPNTLQKLTTALQAPLEDLMQLYDDLPRQILSRLVTDRGLARNTVARGVSGVADNDDLTNLPRPILQALQSLMEDGRGSPGISQVLQAIAQIKSPEKREALITAIAGLVKCYVGVEEDTD